MDGLSTTIIWMAGVVGMMLVFGLIALVGVIRNKDDEE